MPGPMLQMKRVPTDESFSVESYVAVKADLLGNIGSRS